MAQSAGQSSSAKERLTTDAERALSIMSGGRGAKYGGNNEGGRRNDNSKRGGAEMDSEQRDEIAGNRC